ncbi:MAG: T9SS type A sorting domain-containing protein [Lewinellaceae bacterium]|nr:T9SS type A sorting domain-containing protein [Phaeodactylibacter sp.]MCB9041136.1 T9SS type A sorting domain-containing protein [Lewinellaceae bacterium]
MKNIRFLLLLLMGFFFSSLSAQQEFGIHLQPFTIDGFAGIQSFATGQDGHYILLVGGRTDGLHQRQPFASFSPAGNNTAIQVINPISRERWVASTDGLAAPLREQLQSTNMQFYQQDGILYLAGGYGYSPTAGDHITHNRLIAIAVAPLIEAIREGQDIAPCFRQLTDDFFAVTGGYLEKIGNTYYLVGGQRFTGRYNPHNGPSFVQEYTNQIRKFRIVDDGESLSVADKEFITDEVNLHRRDYNALPQIFPDGTAGITAFSGVFQHTQDLPFLNSVDIRPSGYSVNNEFQQYLNHYHCGTAPLYDAAGNKMHSIFFGGISQYFLDETGTLVQDNDVPFVSTIGRVTRSADGNMVEQEIGELPTLLGASSEFIFHPETPQYAPGIIDLNALPADTALIGYLVGGIASTQPNIFFINNGTLSWAQTTLFEVYYVPERISSYPSVEQASNLSGLEAYPNPSKGEVNLAFSLEQSATLAATVQDTNGRIALERQFPTLEAGSQKITLELEELAAGVYIITLTDGREHRPVKVIIE